MRNSVPSLMRGLAALVAAATLAGPASARLSLTQGALRDGERPVVIRGVAYPGLFGRSAALHPCLLARDLPLIAAMGADLIRTDDLPPESDTVFLSLLDTAGLYWLAGFPLDRYYDPSVPVAAAKDRILAEFRRYASRFRGRQRLAGFVFGDAVTEDYNRKFSGSPREFYALLGDAAAILRELEPENPPLLTTAVRNSSELVLDVPGLSFWSWHAGAFAGTPAPAASRPVLIADFDFRQAEQIQSAVVAVAKNSGFLGAIAAGFADLYGGVSTVYPGAGALQPAPLLPLLAESWGGRTPSVAAAPPVLEKITHAAYEAPFASPGALIRVSGQFLTEDPDASFASWPVAGGATCLCVGGVPAPIGFSSAGSLTAEVPWQLPAGDHLAILFRGPVASNVLPIRLERYAPGIFPGAAVRAGTACGVSPDNGVRPGEFLEVYGTGFGGGSLTDTTVEAFVNNTPAAPLYLGLVPGFTGLNQVNIRVDPVTPPSRHAFLELRTDGASSNPYPLSVAGAADRPEIALTGDGGGVLVQAAGNAAVANVRVEGRNGYCGPVLFYAERLPPGITFRAPMAFTGRVVPVEIRAVPGTAAINDASMVLIGQAAGALSGRLEIPLSVLPDRGDIPVRVVSGGFRSTPLARFDWASRTVFSTVGGGPGRGINVLPVDAGTGVLHSVTSFDTWGDPTASARLIAYLSALPNGTIALFAIADDGSYQLSADARTAVASMFGSHFIGSLAYQDSWAMIGRKGSPAPITEHLSTDSQVILDKVLTLPAP